MAVNIFGLFYISEMWFYYLAFYFVHKHIVACLFRVNRVKNDDYK